MNKITGSQKRAGCSLALLSASALLLSACASNPASPDGAMAAREKLTALQNDAQLSSHASVEIRDAERAVQLAEQPLPAAEESLAWHRVYMADRQVDIARARATVNAAEAEREGLGEQRSDARLQARTREADRAHADASQARRSEADMQRRLAELEAKETERGMVITLGDVLFDTGKAQLRQSASGNLDKLVSFLAQYPDQRVLVEGHTDNVGSAQYNQHLSLQRAESVQRYLTQRGTAPSRVSVSGMGLNRAIADNNTASGRQQNRRVEVVIEGQAATR